MFSLLNITPDNMVWFYLAPLSIFGPLFILVLWNFGLKNLFFTPPEVKEQMRQEREHASRIAKRREAKAGTHARIDHPGTRPSALWLGQAAFYAMFAVTLSVMSSWPTYLYSQTGEAQIKISISHPGQRVEACRKRTQEELDKLPPNMRALSACTRERWPVSLEIELDGAIVYTDSARPAGLRKDGASSFYEKFRIPAGTHVLSVKLNDGGPDSATTHTLTRTINLAPAQNAVIGFREDGTGFFLK